ncbi:MAG: hypothetical protein ABUT20_54465, partial [Bacteroidota bacterium]
MEENKKTEERQEGTDSESPEAVKNELSIVNNKLTPETTKSEIENMEVHHHTHSHGKKNWKTYVWEFVMLFLAVFCGFLAEYQLEHVIEHQREKEFARALYVEMKDDSTAAIEKLN